jgi:3-deoxy-7-phosphoheptulonate synthase
MVESNLVEGRQDIPKNIDLPLESMQFGQSVTDACIGWEDTLEVLKIFYDAVEDRRSLLSSSRS